jgi:hypothetical protein
MQIAIGIGIGIDSIHFHGAGFVPFLQHLRRLFDCARRRALSAPPPAAGSAAHRSAEQAGRRKARAGARTKIRPRSNRLSHVPHAYLSAFFRSPSASPLSPTDYGTSQNCVDSNMGIWETIRAMKTTLEIPDSLYRRVKSKSSLDGRPVRSVTQRLYELWLEGRVSLDDTEGVNPEGKGDWESKWVRETASLAERIGKKSDGARLGRDILQDDRR